MKDTADALRVAGSHFELLFRQRTQARALAIAETAAQIESHFVSWATRLRQQLRAQLAVWDHVGLPPSFVSVAGQSNLEKPLNRLLGWWATPEAAHGLGIEFVKQLATLADLSEMVADLQNGDKPEVHPERGPQDDESGKQPDLLVRTSNAALLLENKLWSPESGDQYQPYLELLEAWAGSRTRKAILCARGQRVVPNGWDRAVLHDDLARILDALSRQSYAPVWGRIAAAVCAREFEERDLTDTLRQARELLKETEINPIDPGQLARLRAMLPLPDPPTPWESTNNG